MGIINGTFNQTIKASSKLGGALVVFEGHPSLKVGGFNYDVKDLPDAGDVLPCGTPVYADEANRTIVPVITGKVKSVSSTEITLEDNGFGQTAFKVGDEIAVLPSDLDTAATNHVAITAKDGNVITVSESLTGATAGAILVVVDGTSYKVKAVPNALTPYDVVKDADAVSVDGDAMWANDRPVLERRMPPINDAIKAALVSAGCVFNFSNRK